MDQKELYPSYNGLSRVAMWWGIPLMAVVATFTICMAIALIGSIFWGVGGLFLGCVGLPVLLYLKQICETDDQAFRITMLDLWIFVSRRNKRHFGSTYTLSPMQYGRRPHVYKRNS